MNPRFTDLVRLQPIVTLIAVVSKDGYISTGQGVPWDLPRDKRHFRAATSGQWLLVGRRTYEEMIGWFRDHHPLILTRDSQYHPPVGAVVSTVAEALQTTQNAGGTELFVIGGGEVFEAAMPWADRLIMTHVDAVLEGGVPFPAIDSEVWLAVSCQEHPADAENALPLAFVTYERRNHHPGKPFLIDSPKKSV